MKADSDNDSQPSKPVIHTMRNQIGSLGCDNSVRRDRGGLMKLTFRKYSFLAPSGRQASMHTLCTHALAPEGVTDNILVPLGIAISGQAIYVLS